MRATSRAATSPAMPGADHDDVDLLREGTLTGPAEHGGLCVISEAAGQRAGAEEGRARGGTEQGPAGQGAADLNHSRVLRHDLDMAHNERDATLLREHVAAAARRLAHEGLLVGTAGNVSARTTTWSA